MFPALIGLGLLDAGFWFLVSGLLTPMPVLKKAWVCITLCKGLRRSAGCRGGQPLLARRANRVAYSQYSLHSWRAVPSAERYFLFSMCTVFPREARKNRTLPQAKSAASATL